MLVRSRPLLTNPSTSNRSIAKDMGVLGFLIRQEVHEVIQDENRPIFIMGHEGTREKNEPQIFKKTRGSPQTEYAFVFVR